MFVFEQNQLRQRGFPNLKSSISNTTWLLLGSSDPKSTGGFGHFRGQRQHKQLVAAEVIWWLYSSSFVATHRQTVVLSSFAGIGGRETADDESAEGAADPCAGEEAEGDSKSDRGAAAAGGGGGGNREGRGEDDRETGSVKGTHSSVCLVGSRN